MRLLSVIPARHGWGLLVPVLTLCTMGVLTIQATSSPEAGHALTPIALKQLAFMGAGLAMMVGAIALGYQRFGRWSYAIFGVCLLMLIYIVADKYVNLPFVDAQRNTRRWVRVGPVQLQASELMKAAYVLALAWYLRYRRNFRTLTGLVAPFVLTLLPMGLILIQPDLGTVLLFLPVLFAMLYTAGAKVKHLLVILLLAALASPFFWSHIKGYQRLRITGVVLQSDTIRNYLMKHPDVWDSFRGTNRHEHDEPAVAAAWRRELTEWANCTGFQLVQSKMAIGSGGVFGQGWSRGIFVEYNFLPEKHNDFIFAIVAHQWGLLGGLVVVLCYGLVILIGLDSATLTNDPFGRLVAVGMSTLIGTQAVTNLCMTVGIGPVTGVTLPFVSAGGSSVISSFLCIGLLISVAQSRPMLIANPPFVFDEDAERHS
jgi:rod shape determining protein RodA